MAQFEKYEPIRRLDRERAAVTVREAEPRDVPALATLAADFGEDDLELHTRAFENELRQFAGTELDHLLVAEKSREVVGFARARFLQVAEDAEPDSAPEGYYLSGVVVAPAQRRMGIAKLLTERRIEWVAKRASKVFLVVNAANQASLALQTQMGFRELSRELRYPGLTTAPGMTVVQVLDLPA